MPTETDAAGIFAAAVKGNVIGAFQVIRDGLRSISTLRTFVTEQAAIEQAYASSLKKLCTAYNFPAATRAPDASVTALLSSVYEQTSASAALAAGSSQSLQTQFAAELSELHAKASATADALWSDYSRTLSALQTALAAVATHEARVTAAMASAKHARERLAVAQHRERVCLALARAAAASAQQGRVADRDARDVRRVCKALMPAEGAIAELKANAVELTKTALRRDAAYLQVRSKRAEVNEHNNIFLFLYLLILTRLIIVNGVILEVYYG